MHSYSVRNDRHIPLDGTEFNNKADAKANQCCDVFSYGLVLYEIFTQEFFFPKYPMVLL